MFPLVLLTVLISLVPLAHALPPDHMWIAGVYDAADFDDAVTNVLSIDAATKLHRPSPKPLWLAGDRTRFGRPELYSDPVAANVAVVLPSDVRRIDSARSPPSLT